MPDARLARTRAAYQQLFSMKPETVASDLCEATVVARVAALAAFERDRGLWALHETRQGQGCSALKG